MDNDKLEAAHAIMNAIQNDILKQFERQNFGPSGLDELVKFCEDVGLDAADILRRAIYDTLKGIDRVHQRYARWIFDEYNFAHCSRCRYEQNWPEWTTPYCPQCGARMDGGESE